MSAYGTGMLVVTIVNDDALYPESARGIRRASGQGCYSGKHSRTVPLLTTATLALEIYDEASANEEMEVL